MTLILILLLVLGGMSLFDSMLHAFGTAGTGGFGIKSNSVEFYQSPYLEMVIGVFMILFGTNFNLYYFLLLGSFSKVFKSEELRWYLCIIASAVGLITINILPLYDVIRCAVCGTPSFRSPASSRPPALPPQITATGRSFLRRF